LDLAKAAAMFVNQYFSPNQTIEPEHIMATNGVSSLLDIITFSICDPGEAVMLATPNYGMFKHDLQSRNAVRIVDIECDLENEDFDRFTASNAQELIRKYEAAYKKAREENICIRAVLICNPCNPLGRCYSRSTLEKLARFCAQRRLHLISDEIYALSVISPSAGKRGGQTEVLDTFTSALSITKVAKCDPAMIHVLYGASKDFGLSALRLGFLVTQNPIVKESCRRIA
jgi:aspartate/methionine/tyrosine aminotransferase